MSFFFVFFNVAAAVLSCNVPSVGGCPLNTYAFTTGLPNVASTAGGILCFGLGTAPGGVGNGFLPTGPSTCTPYAGGSVFLSITDTSGAPQTFLTAGFQHSFNRGFDTCTAIVTVGGLMTNLQLTDSSTGTGLTLLPCSLTFSFLGKRGNPGFLNLASAGTFSGPGSMIGDPHIQGPLPHQKFDFKGQPNGIYTLVSSPHFVINVRLAAKGPEARFINELALNIGDTSITFNTYQQDSENVNRLNKLLTPLGGAASYGASEFDTLINLCPGHSVKIAQMKTTPGSEKVHGLNETMFYLDVELDVPGCHDEFGGILGHLYQCQYLSQEFVWDASSEETYRVPTLATASGKFSPSAKCYPPREFGVAYNKTALASIKPGTFGK